MSLKSDLKSELQTHSAGHGPRTLAVRAGDDRLVCELADLNTLAVELLRLTLHTPRLADATLDRLSEISEQLSKRLTYLLEPVGPVELDAESATVQMRSIPPTCEEDATSYYEILVRRGGEVALCRYQKAAGEPRQVIPAVVTREVLFRLAEDFQEVLQERR